MTLRLPETGPAVREAVDSALSGWQKDRSVAVSGPPVAESVREFAVDTERLLTHTHAFAVRTEDRS